MPSEGDYTLALTLDSVDYNPGVDAIYRDASLALIDSGRALTLDYNDKHGLMHTVNLDDSPLLPGLCSINPGSSSSWTVLGVSPSSSSLVRIRATRNQSDSSSEVESELHVQPLPSQYAGRHPVASHGLVPGPDSEEAPALLVAFSDGALLKAEWSEQEGQFYESELVREQSVISSIRSLWPTRRRIANGSSSAAATPQRKATTSNSSNAAASAPAQIISFESSKDLAPSTLFTVSRDRRLRIWSTATNQCTETIQLPSTSQTMDIVPVSPTGEALEQQQQQQAQTTLLPSNSRPLLRLFATSSSPQDAYMLMYIPTSNVQTSFFILYSVLHDGNGNVQTLSPLLEKPCDFALEAQSSCQLCDFGYVASSNELWTLWTENGQAVVRYSSLDAKQDSSRALALRQSSPDPDATISEISSPWYTVLPSLVQKTIPLDQAASAFDRNLEQLYTAYQAVITEQDLRPSAVEAAHQLTVMTRQAAISSFLSHLFHPGRYPVASIQAALYRYLQSLKSARIPSRRDGTLAQQVLDAVAAHLQVRQDQQTGALLEQEYVKQVRLEWLKLLALAEEGRREAVLPLSMAITPSGDVSVLLRHGTATTMPTDPVSRLETGLQSGRSADDLTCLAQDGGQTEDIATILEAAKLLSDSLDTTALSSFAEASTRAATSPIEVAILDLANGIYDETLEPYIDDELASRLISALAGLQSQQKLLSTLSGAMLALVQSNKGYSNRMETEGQAVPKAGLSSVSTQLVLDHLATAGVVRYELCMQLFALLIFVAGEMMHPDEATWPENVPEALLSEEAVIEAVSSSLACVRARALTKWLLEHNIAMTDISAEQNGDAEAASADSLMQQLSSLRMRNSQAGKMAAEALRPQSVWSVLAGSDAYSTKGPAEVEGMFGESQSEAEQVAVLAAALQAGQRLSEALLFIEQIPEKDEDAALLHIKACIAAERGDAALAEHCFDRVAAAIYAEHDSLANLRHIVPAASCEDLTSYYRLVVSAFDGREADISVARYCKLAIEAFEANASPQGNPDEQPTWVRDLWAKQFRCLTAVGEFDAAYACMMSLPVQSLRRECLRQLVAVMCESNLVATLLGYSFIGMHAEVIQTLSFRARNSHPLAVPDHYKILFAFHSSRCDYRAAASVMYQKASRLAAASGDFAVQEAVTAQCQSYLVAMDALALMAEDKQFILVDVDGQKAAKPKRKRQRLLDAPVPDPAVVTLEMIRKEYILCLAKLQLSRDFPELSRSNKFIDPANAVALFSQIGSLDAALQTALALEVDMSNVFENIAIRCVHLGQHRAQSGSSEAWLLRDENASRWEGTLASKAWRLLEQYLSRYDDRGEYRKRVLDVIMEEDRRTRLPKWLVSWFMGSHPEYLIWKLVEYDLLEEAFVHAFEMVEESRMDVQRSGGTKRAAAGMTYLPYNLLDQLLLVDLSEEVAARREGIEGQQRELRALVEGQQRAVREVWSAV